MTGPLEGVRVVEMTHFLAGPYAGMTLADLGADVIKLEDPSRPDEARSMGPYFQDELSLYFASLNWGKRSVGIHLDGREGRAVAAAVLAGADVLLENYRPGVLAGLGFGPDEMRSMNPRLVTCSLTGFGQNGPDAQRPGYDYTIQAMSGVMSMGGEPDGPPSKAGISYVDHGGGLAAALAICAALVERTRTGRGRHIDLGLLDVQVSMLSYLASWAINAGYEPKRTPDSAHPTLVPAQNFPTADGWISIFVGNDWMWQRFVEAAGDARLEDVNYAERSGRLAHRDELLHLLRSVLATDTTTAWTSRFTNAGVACAPVNNLAGGLAEPQVEARGLVTTTLTASGSRYSHVRGPVPSLGRADNSGAPALGQHTREVLVELGLDDSLIWELEQAGVVTRRQSAGARNPSS